MIEFKLPNTNRYAEQCALNLTFQEVKVRNTNEILYQFLVEENCINMNASVSDTYNFSSWESMKNQYPKLLDFLLDLSKNELWSSDHINNDRIYFFESLTGHEGLYDVDKTICFDGQNKDINSYTDIKKNKTKNKIK